jgi:hypothetical protein
VLDRVGVVRESLFKKLFEVVCGRLRLTLATACDRRVVLLAGAAYLRVDVAVVMGHSLLAMLFTPLLVALLGILGGDVRRQFPDAAWGRARLSHLVDDGVPSGGS